MGTIILSLSRGLSTRDVIRQELDRIERATGCRPVDWLWEIHDTAVQDNMTDGYFDFDSFEMQVACNADNFIDFVRENYPATVALEAI